jgi:HlyD family secretion protein
MSAEVTRIDIESDRVNEERRIYVRCAGCPHTFHLGEQAEVVVTVATLPKALMVKLSALANVSGHEATGWTVENGRLRQRQVTFDHRTLDGRFEIVGGVPDGAQVVGSAIAGLRVGRAASIATTAVAQ